MLLLLINYKFGDLSPSQRFGFLDSSSVCKCTISYIWIKRKKRQKEKRDCLPNNLVFIS